MIAAPSVDQAPGFIGGAAHPRGSVTVSARRASAEPTTTQKRAVACSSRLGAMRQGPAVHAVHECLPAFGEGTLMTTAAGTSHPQSAPSPNPLRDSRLWDARCTADLRLAYAVIHKPLRNQRPPVDVPRSTRKSVHLPRCDRPPSACQGTRPHPGRLPLWAILPVPGHSSPRPVWIPVLLQRPPARAASLRLWHCRKPSLTGWRRE